ncbi:MAG: cofactor-independent phosphoglycerate mutase [Parabacteroides sp.]|jgi:2,3-bisphosphoglycerate-independent phosphoglycerate mutase|nr:cofactor-independent phosphoglycerate mutase [Parabacteroides sp.]MBP8759614.1 cofactor-independent phosphoglycerate mutase [Parabacteroides sp.]MBP9481240.1 cofactor-independent phosphoglycerate mutase [Parabacteroides sp.]MDD3358136.1 cofactor-independent phosphoglycerate mutase [Parabacteroides sp.]MDD4405635.1 cofactor-independent phosphoglycerate mutase [Parabacteroides sp.]
MKHIVILGDGMADEPIEALGGLTPMQAADTPYMDKLASLGRNGRLQTVPEGFHPGSEVANMAVLGYNMPKVYEGRGVLEAASIGVELQPGDLAMRCNLICVEGDILKNHSSGHISTEEADELIKFLNKELGNERIIFYTGVSYRHLLVIKGGDKRLDCTPPHDVPLRPFRPLLIKPEVAEANDTAELLNNLILKSQEILPNHPVNKHRIAIGKDPANSIWPWSPGYRPAMETMQQMYGFKKGAVISAVDLIRGIGVYAGLEVLTVEGATGLYDTNYEGKAQAALEALKTNDFVYLHIEASDEAGHEGDVDLKIKTIENLDKRAVKIIYEALQTWDEPVAIAILPDHPTPCAIRTHTSEPIPFIIYKPGQTPDSVQRYDEFAAREGSYGELKENEFMLEFLKD